MGKLLLGLIISGVGIGAFLGVLNTAANMGAATDPVTKQATEAVNQLPGATVDSLKRSTDAISGNDTANGVASQSDAYRGTKAAVDTTSTFMKVINVIWALIKMVFLVSCVIALVALVTRTISRRGRTYRMYEIRAHRESMISTEQIRSFMSSVCTLMYVRSRRWQRVFKGSPSLTYRVLAWPNRKRGDSEVAVYVQIPEDPRLDELFRRAFSDAYQDAELREVKGPRRWGQEIVRLKKTRAIPYTLRVPGISQASESFQEGFNSPVMDKIVTTMTSRKLPAEVQYVLTAVPRPFDRFMYQVGRLRHESAMTSDAIEKAEGSNTAAASSNEAHVFAEIRIGSPEYDFSRDIAAVLAGAAGGDAQLRERRPRLRKKLYQDRFFKGIGNPIPSWMFCVLSTSELSSLWQLPSAQLRSISTKRSNRRRVSVPPEVCYPHNPDEMMWLSPEGRSIALKKIDFLYGVAAMGQQGMGKTAHMASMSAALLNLDPNFGSLICDPKGDLARATLAYLSPERKVRYIDFNNPEVGIDPFLLANARDEQAIVNVVLHGIIDVARTEEDESQIMASSKDFLTNAIFATLATTVPFKLRPTMFHLRKWISTDPENIKWQKRLLTEVISHRPDRHFIVDAYAEFHSSLERSEAQFTTRAAAPLNKVAELCGEAVDRIIRHPNALNLEECILNREVIIVNGRNHKSADLVFRFLWQMVDQALGRIESETPRAEDRPKFLFVVDESPAILTPTTSQIIARRRSAGLHMMVGWQHDAQISNPKVLSTLRSLLQNVFQFRTSPEDARERVDLMQMTYDDQQDSRLREIRTNRVSVADLINADRFVFYTAHLVDGNRVPTYWGTTINPEARPNHAAAHLLDQAADHGQKVGILAAPDLEGQARKAREQMLFNPPKFPSVTEADEYAKPLMESLGIDFERALATNDPARVEPPDGDSGDGGGAGALEPPDESETPQETEESSTTGIAAPKAAAPDAPVDPGPEVGRSRPNNKNGQVHTSALDEEIEFSRDKAVADASEVAIEANGFNDERPKRNIAEIGKVEIGPLGQVIPGEIAKLMEYVDVFRSLDSNAPINFKDPPEEPSGSVAARNTRAEQMANTSSLFPANWHKILSGIYEFNYLTNQQIQVITGIGSSTVSQRMNLWLKNGVVRGMEIGGQRVWTLTDLGARVGRQLTSRFGPIIPLEPGKGEEGRYEASRKWTARNTPNARGIIHDLHLASFVTQFMLLCDGDMRVFDNPQEGIVSRFRGEFGSVVEPPKVKARRGAAEVSIDLNSISQMIRGLGFTGIHTDDPTLGTLSPDAVLSLHNLAPENPDPKKGRREIWFELDRQGHSTKLRDKLVRLDAFLGVWWRTVPRFRKAQIPPSVIFVAPNVEILKRQLAIADETLVVRAGQTRLGSATWGTPVARKRVFFALETDLHKGSMRVYRVPEKTPRERAADASDQRERTEVRVIQPRMDDLLPKRLLAGRRLGAHEFKGH